MKSLSQLVTVLVCAGLSSAAFAADTTTTKTTNTTDTTTAATTTATTTVTATTPTEACKGLVAAATKKDFATVQAFSLTPGRGEKSGKMMEKGFDKMKTEHMEKLGTITCGTETVAEDHAFVQAKTEQTTRLIPFVKTEAGWRFDTKTYMSFYNFGPHGGKGMHHMGKGKRM